VTPASQEPRPIDITLDREQHELRIKWTDGTECRYPLDALREACPCALCRGGHEYMGKQFDPDLRTLQPTKHVTVREITMVGNYAINILWDDLHDEGIYSWDYLYRICPQEER
jgi:DUF971 family protein